MGWVSMAGLLTLVLLQKARVLSFDLTALGATLMGYAWRPEVFFLVAFPSIITVVSLMVSYGRKSSSAFFCSLFPLALVSLPFFFTYSFLIYACAILCGISICLVIAERKPSASMVDSLSLLCPVIIYVCHLPSALCCS